jgi:predicted transcriptional regulator
MPSTVQPDPPTSSVFVSQPRKPPRAASETPRIQEHFRLSAEGLAKVLGDLEARVMRAVWDLGRPVPARRVHEVVFESHEVAPLTVITVLNKLVTKGLLRRAKRDDLLHYEPRWSEEEFMMHASRRVVEEVLAFEPDVVAASFVDVLAERDPALLAELARTIRRRLRKPE